MYGRNAAALSQALRLEAPELPVKLNPAKPRRGSFEVTLLRPDGSSEWGTGSGRRGQRSEEGKGQPWREVVNFALLGLSPGAELWTGIKKGPPRKLKFPEPQEVVEKLKKYLP